MKRRIVAFCLAIVMAGALVVPAKAASTRSAVINVAYGITLLFNDQEAKLTDAKGRKVEPFVSNGTTYVPIRAVSELFGATIDYDATSNSAYIHNDLAEMCGEVYYISYVVNVAYSLATAETGSVATVAPPDFSQDYQKIKQLYSDCVKRHTNLTWTNKYEKVVADTIMPDFFQFWTNFDSVNSAYQQYRNNPNQTTFNAFVSVNDKANLNQLWTKSLNGITSFFNTYCIWR